MSINTKRNKIAFKAHIKSHNVKNLVSLDKGVSISLLAIDVEEKRKELAHWLIELPADNECLVKIALNNGELERGNGDENSSLL